MDIATAKRFGRSCCPPGLVKRLPGLNGDRLSTRSKTSPESRRCLGRFCEGQPSKNGGFVCSRDLIMDADRKFHRVRVRIHWYAVQEPVIQ